MAVQIMVSERLFLGDMVPRPLLVHHVARRLGLSPRTVRHLAKTRKLAAYKIGKKIWHFRPADVAEFHARREARYAQG